MSREPRSPLQFTGGVGKSVPVGSETVLHTVEPSDRRKNHLLHSHFQSFTSSDADIRIRTGTLTVNFRLSGYELVYLPVCVITPVLGSANTNILVMSSVSGITCTGFVEISG